jgi:hypothetical protein
MQTLHITNALGQSVLQTQVMDNEPVNIAALPSGVYRVSTGTHTWMLVKQQGY